MTETRTKNKLSDLNDHLFAQLERLADEGLTAEQIDQETKRGDAIVAVADQIIRNASLQVQAAKLIVDHGDRLEGKLPAVMNGTPHKLIESKRQ
jgi:hypothetical protein